MFQHTIAELSQLLQSKSISSVALTRAYIERCESLDTELNCFITLTPELALQQAKAADDRIQSGTSEALTGIPIAHKDIFCSKNIKTSCGSKMLDNFVAPYDATVVERLANAGMVTLGKTNMDEFAMGSSNETSFYGPALNPWDKQRVPGGSSGGSASAVAARLVAGATGTDTGGSIRQPAAMCGITGLKPTYGRVSRYGMIAYASSLDQGGPLTQTAEDAAMLLSTMAGFDERDSTSVDRPVDNYNSELTNKLDGIKIGLPKEFFNQNLDSDIGDNINSAIKILKECGAVFKEIELPNSHLSIPAYYVVAPAECSSNLERYDGVRYGYRCEDPKDLADLYCRSRGESFGEEVKRRIMIGTYVLSSGYYDAYYLQAQKIRRLIRDDFQQAFNDVDIILGPTTPTTAFKLNENMDDPVSMYLSDIYTVSANLAGLPGISIPSGFSNGLPVGMQLMGNYFQESKLLNIAHQYQLQTDWHKQIPGEFKES
ncbi:MAG: Asp-tRNA(Asn)/Glu-tRNA(Gln) amidotransferase subunit GatA [Gammaproteobacteria bacterium]|jgi:aspartyl-tRNA(Asn)/glutamyl-tRNA(Gln) amidotransferase subunit A|nr:Asp-tRNA(Asn)/Glu-tRNA(Gln) amidotransferase subunit GatA [Gammaproteobacteria bacterium]